MDRLSEAHGRFVRAGNGWSDASQGGCNDGTQRGRGADPAAGGAEVTASVARRLEALALASMALGWECVQSADERGFDAFPALDPDGLTAATGSRSGRPGTDADWERFDAALIRVRREIRAADLTGVGLALLDFAQACRITAARLGDSAAGS